MRARQRLGLAVLLVAAVVGVACSSSDAQQRDDAEDGGRGTGETDSAPADLYAGHDAVSAADAPPAPDSRGPDGDGADADVVAAADTVAGDVAAPLALIEIDPSSGHAAGGELVAVRGSGFPEGCAVLFGQSAAPTVVRLSASELTVATPPGRPGLVDVALRCPGAPGDIILPDGFLYFRDVVVESVTPAEGPVEGGTPVTVRGTGFAADARLVIGGRRALAIEVVDDQTLIAITPPGEPGPADVHVSQASAVAVLRRGFTFTRRPAVELVLPAAGPVAGGTTVTIRGAGFAAPATVWFGAEQSPSVAVLAEDAIEAVTPAADGPGAVSVSVSTPLGLARLEGAFSYVQGATTGGPLRLLAVTPGTGSVLGGDRVALVAAGLPPDGDLTVLFGGGSATVESVDPALGMAFLRTPPAAGAGSVDVAAVGATGSDTLTDGFVYRAGLAVTAVAPSEGPAGGGTPIAVLGAGFAEGAQVFVGALPATGVVVEDDGRIRAVTPEGSPGLADVRVLQGGERAVLEDGFLFTAPFDLYGIVPDTGAVAGGTFVEWFGAGFDADTVPYVDGRPCTHVVVRDPTRIGAKTPPGAVGTVDVAVHRADGATRGLPQAFTYFDPLSENGGTWGGAVEGSVNVTVIDPYATPLADAYVMLGTDPDTPYQGWTNGAGQITFSGPDVLGEQMVSASKECYASDTVVEFDATNVTLVLIYNCPSSGGPPPSIPPASVSGQVFGLEKYVIPPLGRCSNRPFDTYACKPCATNAECFGGTVCTQVGEEGLFCAFPCDGERPCEDLGYSCRGVGVDDARCLPDTGERVAICRTTRPEILQPELPEPGPGMETDEDNRYSIATAYGELAIVCIGGVRDDFGVFTPMRMGVARHVQPTFDNPLIEDADVFLETPLTRTIALRADEVAFDNARGPQFLFAFVYLDLGSDGFWDFEVTEYTFDPTEPLPIPYMPQELSGAIFDASYTMLVGAFSQVNAEDNTPYSLTVRRRIRALDDDSVLVRGADGRWETRSTGIDRDVNALWGTSDTDVWAVGARGLLVHHDGFGWSPQPAPTEKRRLNALWGPPEGGHMVAAGEAGTVLDFNGASWARRDIPVPSELRAVWGFSPDDVWVAGSFATWHWNGTTWQAATGSASRDIYGLWGAAPDDLWAVGAWGTVLHYDGAAWTMVNAGTGLRLRDVWGAAPDDVWAVGERGLLVHWDGAAWTAVPSGTTEHLGAVWGRAADDVIAVGTRGVVLRYDGNAWRREGVTDYTNALNAIWSPPPGAGDQVFAMGTHELLLGPLLGVPRFVNPLEDSPLVGATVEWTVDPEPTQADFTLLQVAVPSLFGDIPIWSFLADGGVTTVPVPDFPAISGTPGIAPGFYKLTAVRGFKEGFDIDNYDFFDLNQLTWRSWSIDVLYFTR